MGGPQGAASVLAERNVVYPSAWAPKKGKCCGEKNVNNGKIIYDIYKRFTHSYYGMSKQTMCSAMHLSPYIIQLTTINS